MKAGIPLQEPGKVYRQTVQGWLRSGELPIWQQQCHGSSIDGHADHLNRRWDEGYRNAAQLWREIRDQSFGRLPTVQRWFITNGTLTRP